ncbi:MAG: hypothetical protein GEU79_07300 [Acidimicrobiia bacterium]|nr:hypothetical protein [Acidimicrobiia bacterium]
MPNHLLPHVTYVHLVPSTLVLCVQIPGATLTDNKPAKKNGDDGFSDQIAENLVSGLGKYAIDGFGPFDSAREVAEAALAKRGTVDGAIKELIDDHTRLAGINGFVTGLGGFVTLPVALPANVVGFYAVATRLVAAIAHLRGHNIDDEVTRTAVMITLTGDDASNLLAQAGAVVPAGRATTVALKRLPKSAMALVNKAIGFRLLVIAGGKGMARLGRLIPVVGGLVGGAIDVVLLRSVAKHARKEFADATITVE